MFIRSLNRLGNLDLGIFRESYEALTDTLLASWLLSQARKGKTEQYEAAFSALCRLRHTRLQAARDLFLMHHLLDNEEHIKQNQ